MKILYDHQIFTIQNYGGISRYFSSLIGQFERRNIGYELPAMYTNNYYINAIARSGDKRHKTVPINNKYLKRAVRGYTSHYNEFRSIELLRRSDFDVFHPTYYDPYFLKYLKDKPLVITVYDMIHEIYPEYFGVDNPLLVWKRELIDRADEIIAISENTKRDVVNFYDIDKSKVHVIYLGNSLASDATADDMPVKIPDKYILYVGDRSNYKNFYLMAESTASLMEIYPDLHLLCVGGGPFTAKEKIFLNNIKVGDQVCHYTARDDELSGLYRRALAFVFPSLYEGFGIPVLEAFASGCPVVLSNTSSLPEVAGDAAVYFDPKDTSSIKNAIISVLNGEGLRGKLIQKGKDRLKQFSWEKCAKETLAVYNSLK